MKEIGVASWKLPHVKCLASIFAKFSPAKITTLTVYSKTYQSVVRRHGKLLYLSGHGCHIGRGHPAHSRELGDGRIRGVHLGVARHGVHGRVGGVGPVWSGRRGVDVAHHSVTCRVDDRGQGFGQLFFLLSVFRSSVLKPYLKGIITH